MATAHLHRLKGNVQKAIDYILKKEKTLPYLIEAKNCNMNCAGIEWRLNHENGKHRKSSIDDVVGYHFHQNFEANTVTPEQAFEITKEWIESYTGGNHDYVIATHIDHMDKGMIHTHVIVNPYNNKNGKHWHLYMKKALPDVRRLSDEICRKHNLNTLNQDIPSKSNDYYAWMMKQRGDSHKDIIMKAIDNILPQMKDYSEFKQYLCKLGFKVEDGSEDSNNRKGLRIMVPNGKKFIRCDNIMNHDNFSYSLQNITDKIKANGIFVTKKEVKEFLNAKETKNNKIENRNKFYEECNIKIPFETSQFNNLSPQEKMYVYKKQNIAALLSDIHKANIIISSINELDDLKKLRSDLQTNIDDVSKMLKENESQLELMMQQRIDGILEISENDIDEYLNTRILPYRTDKKNLQNEIKEISERINKADTILRNEKTEESISSKER